MSRVQNVQKKVYHKNRFYKTPQIPRMPASEDENFKDIFLTITQHLTLQDSFIERGTLVLLIDRKEIITALEFLKNESFVTLSEMSAVHFLDDSFEVFYQLLSYKLKLRIRVKCKIPDDDKSIDSVCKIYRNAIWSEREVYDMFGIHFNDHPYLKRILMPDDWEGHPLRKDYPLHGDEKASWYEVDKIFGPSYREIIGREQRDSSFVNPKDTFNFSHMGYEVSRGEPVSTLKHPVRYQEEGGVFVVTKLNKESKLLKERR